MVSDGLEGDWRALGGDLLGTRLAWACRVLFGGHAVRGSVLVYDATLDGPALCLRESQQLVQAILAATSVCD